MMRRRQFLRRTGRPPCRRAHRPGYRARWRAPDDLGQALVAFRRAIRAHRRLARLAPHHFDAAVVERDRLEHQERLRWMQLWEPALEKVYGPPTPAEREARRHADWLAGQPPRLSPATQCAVDRQRAAWEFWLAAGRLAKERHQQRRPHALLSLGRIARLLEIAMDFGRLATGLDSPQPAFVPHDDAAAWADLHRAYGHLDPEPCPITPDPPATSPPAEPAPPGDIPPSPAAPSAVLPPIRPPPAAAPSPPPRCDAYRRLARQLSRRRA